MTAANAEAIASLPFTGTPAVRRGAVMLTTTIPDTGRSLAPAVGRLPAFLAASRSRCMVSEHVAVGLAWLTMRK